MRIAPLGRLWPGIGKPVLRTLLRCCAWALPRRRFEASEVKRILVFSYQGLGNFIMYTPALKLLRERFPEALIDLQVGGNKGCRDVLSGTRLFDEILYVPYSIGLRAWLRRALEIRRKRYDLTINEFHSHSFLLAAHVVASKAPFRLGHVTSPGWSRRFSRYSFVFNLPVTMREDEHEVERYLDLVERTGAGRVPLTLARPFIHIDEADRAFAKRFLDDLSLPAGTTLVGIQPGTSRDMSWKQWPVERFRELVRLLMSSHPEWAVVVFGNDAEAEMSQRLTQGLHGRVAVAAGRTSVKQVAALIELCAVLVCNDSGLMHVATAMGTPVAAIFGPTDIRRTLPLGPAKTVIRHPLPCSPCFRLEGDLQPRLCPHHDCLLTIRPEEVLGAVEKTVGFAPAEAQARLR